MALSKPIRKPAWASIASGGNLCPHSTLLINVVRSVVDQRTGKCKTEASAKPVPIDEYTAEDLLAWYRLSKYKASEDWVFASDDPRLSAMRGKQPLWLSKIMQYHIQPLVKRLGRQARVVEDVSQHVHFAPHRQQRKRQGGAGAAASCQFEDDDGRLCAGRDEGQASCAAAYCEGSAQAGRGEEARCSRRSEEFECGDCPGIEVVSKWFRRASKTGRKFL